MKVVIGLSGGVDSSVSALLLKKQGFDVIGVFMKNWEEDDDASYCHAKEDLSDVQRVCQILDIPLKTINFSAEYWDNVFTYFLEEYKAGRTPNPDILCNKEIKFKAFLDYAMALNADYMATGHYAKINALHGQTQLCKATDQNKDQSYFLHAISRSALEKTLFPLAELTKPAVREIAKKARLPIHNKKDSTGICFIGERKFKDFLKQYLPSQKGSIKTLSGQTLGEHDGLMYHTIGQRQGLKIGGIKNTEGKPWYVIEKDLNNNTLIVAQGVDHPRLFSKTLEASELRWFNEPPANKSLCMAKIRYRQNDQVCQVTFNQTKNSVLVQFEKPQRAITEGQSIVFYDNDVCLGGGVIHAKK